MANEKCQVGFRLLVVLVQDQRIPVWKGDQNYEHCSFLLTSSPGAIGLLMGHSNVMLRLMLGIHRD